MFPVCKTNQEIKKLEDEGYKVMKLASKENQDGEQVHEVMISYKDSVFLY
ncbi:hypothetical protein [Priestia aryabhattai]|nr:hypothetical protein [Priestia aryabhattai]MED4261459.1 hypothetical protein [Priestia aryabhattai]